MFLKHVAAKEITSQTGDPVSESDLFWTPEVLLPAHPSLQIFSHELTPSIINHPVLGHHW